MKQEMTKAELIKSITHKAQKAKPMVRELFTGGLKYRRKKELIRLNNKMIVSRSGWDITTI